MSQYHVYGLGNALVDIEIELAADELQRLGVEKGIMTLIDEDRHFELLELIQGNQHKRACGGSAANTIIAVAQLGGNSFYSCRIGNDETGDFYLKDLHQEGVHSNLESTNREEGITGKCIVMITPDADRSMNTFLGITSELTESLIDSKAIAESKYLYIEGYLASSPTAVQTAVKCIEIAKQNNVKVAFSLSDPAMVQFCREGLDAMLSTGVDLLFCNHDEALAYTGCETVDEAAKHLSNIATQFAITVGADGALVFDGSLLKKIEGFKADAVDTNGAGDLFAGSFLYGITKGHSIDSSAKLANYASSKLVTSFGPRLTKRHLNEVIEYAKSIG